jgi:hypothetical protein
MVHFKEESIDAWALRLRSDDLLAVICGFAPGQVPGVATFYAFQDRFWPGRQLYHIRKAKKKRKEKPAKGEKLPLKNPSVVKRIVSRLMNGRTFSCKEENVLHQILAISVVMPSLDLGLLGDPKNMTIAGDGSPYESGSSPYGKKLCLVPGEVRLYPGHRQPAPGCLESRFPDLDLWGFWSLRTRLDTRCHELT